MEQLSDSADMITSVVQAAAVLAIVVPICVWIWYRDKERREDRLSGRRLSDGPQPPPTKATRDPRD
jgi:hypothetical protein